MNKLIISLMNINAIFTDWRRITANKRMACVQVTDSTAVLNLVSNDCYVNVL